MRTADSVYFGYYYRQDYGLVRSVASLRIRIGFSRRDSKPPIWERRSYKIIESTGQQLLALFPKFLVRIDPPKRFVNGNALRKLCITPRKSCKKFEFAIK